VHVTAPPGSAFAYSGANFLVLELLVEEVSGQPFQAYMASHLFQPLHMTHSQYGLPSRFHDVMAVPYDSLGKRLAVLRYNELAAAGLTTDLHDLAAFAAAGLPGRTPKLLPGRGVLKPTTVALMQSPAPSTRWAERDPFGPAPQYGLGHTVRPEQFAGRVGVGHGGTNNGWESLFQIVPATGDGIVIMTNSSNGSAVIASLLCAWRRWGGGPAVDCPRVEVRIPLLGAYATKGADEAVAVYRRLRREEPEGYDFSVTQLNSMGYQLMRSGDLQGALAIFNLNVEAYPSDWIPYDSVAEAYAKAGDKARAIAGYRRSIELNPANDNGREALKALGASPVP
jgi:CubicO group peptidase (beta-lactamase class C family)